MSETRIFSVGIDIGQKVDCSAICLAEILENKAMVRLLTKYALGTPYNLLVETVVRMIHDVETKGVIEHFTVDATGIGASPAAMFQEALPHLRIDPFIFTNKSKRELIGKVKILHSFGRLRFATKKGDELYNRTLTELMTEMKQLQAKVLKGEEGNAEIEVFKTGTHDDLFTALALAVKDINFPQSSIEPQFIEDKSWVTTPLDTGAPEVLFF